MNGKTASFLLGAALVLGCSSPPPSLGERCPSAGRQECGDGLVCSATRQVCVLRGTTEACTDNWDCRDGYYCEAGSLAGGGVADAGSCKVFAWSAWPAARCPAGCVSNETCASIGDAGAPTCLLNCHSNFDCIGCCSSLYDLASNTSGAAVCIPDTRYCWGTLLGANTSTGASMNSGDGGTASAGSLKLLEVYTNGDFSAYGCAAIKVTVANQAGAVVGTGEITQYYPGRTPDGCHAAGCAHFSLPEGYYRVSGSCGSTSWPPTAIALVGSCVRQQLTTR